jgi:septal ring factor EnvC (AmiA/AmiB activator)
MAFDTKMYKHKKKRAVDPNAPPRPNLLSQDKKLREQQASMEQLQNRLDSQADEIRSLDKKVRYMAGVIETLHGKINSRK